MGAGQTIGLNLTATAAPDGYTMAVTNPSHAINATLMPGLPYDPVKDLMPLTVLATQPYAGAAVTLPWLVRVPLVPAALPSVIAVLASEPVLAMASVPAFTVVAPL